MENETKKCLDYRRWGRCSGGPPIKCAQNNERSGPNHFGFRKLNPRCDAIVKNRGRKGQHEGDGQELQTFALGCLGYSLPLKN